MLAVSTCILSGLAVTAGAQSRAALTVRSSGPVIPPNPPEGGAWYPTAYALAVSGGDLYVGGDFTIAGGSIAKWNGIRGTNLP
jgi:hypothetical protein